MTDTVTRPLEWSPPKQAISRVPYLPGLDGMRAIAVVAVMIYHANTSWLPGGFLGVEVFFVISGYLITLLLVGEHERTGTVNLGQFYLRRARRLLPALFVLLVGLMIYTTLFRSDALGQLRGDVVAGLTYVTNWYQIWVGQGYTASGDFAPLRHLWSLAVEEQFYLLWPLIMIGLMRLGRRRLPELSRWLFLFAVLVAVALAGLYHRGPIDQCDVTPEAYWQIGDRCISKVDALYLNTFTRAGGLMLGAAFAMIWRPIALRRGPIREKGPLLDLIALIGLIALASMTWAFHLVTPAGADPWLFRGGFFLCGLATIMIMAAVTHPGAIAGRLLGTPALLWIGTRSYGLYLFHWPVYQIIREVAGNPLTISEFALAIVITVPITELSYRFIETPIRTGRMRTWWHTLRAQRDPTPRRVLAGAGAGVVALSLFAAANMATAELKPNEIAQSLAAAEESTVDLSDLVATTTTVASAEAPADQADGAVSPATSVAGAGAAPGATATPTPTSVGAAGPTSIAPTTTAAATTTTALPPGATLAIGDSVMQGAAGELNDRGILVDAAESRQMNTMIPTVEDLRDTGALDGVEAVVVHLGTNGPFTDETATQFFGALAGVPRVVVLTVRANKDWIAGNNERIIALPGQFPNVSVLYWDGLAPQCPGACFYDDGIHLRPDGQRYYAQLVEDFVAA
jgi:peptidoglycan/LPS O-acetylase OafA/YrhL